MCEHVHLPAQSGSSRDPQGDAPHVRPRALPPPRRSAPRSDSRSRARDGSHRRLPGRDRGRLRGDALARGGGAVRQRLHVHLLATRRDRGCRAARTRFPTTSSTSDSSDWSRSCNTSRAERNEERVGRVEEVLVEGPSRTDHLRQRGRTRRNTTVNFAGAGVPGELVNVVIDSATSTTLRGREASLVAA